MKKLLAAILAVCTVLSVMMLPAAATTGMEDVNLSSPIIGYSADTSKTAYNAATKETTEGANDSILETAVDLGDTTAFPDTFDYANKTPSGNYKITDVRGLKNFATWSSQQQFKDANDADVVVYLADNITWNEETSILPLGSKGFFGVFDGLGHTISNLEVVSTTKLSGLFTHAYNGAVIRNVVLKNCSFTSSAASGGIGGIVGNANGCTIQNCYVSNPTFKATAGATSFGGIVGLTNVAGSKILNCTFDGSNTLSHTIAGGIVGRVAHSITIDKCLNLVSITGSTYAGGIVGDCYVASTFTNCINQGAISGSETSSKAAGIIGNIRKAKSTIQDCKNYGNVSAGADAHPIVTFTSDSTITFDKFTAADYATKAWIYGYQTKDVYINSANESVRDVRIVGVIDSLDYKNVGFTITVKAADGNVVTGKDSVSKDCKYVYTSLVAMTDGEQDTVAVDNVFPGGYFFALTIKGVPAANEYTFEVQAYSTELEATDATDGEAGSFTLERKN